MEKVCTKCKRQKPVSAFHKDPRRHLGVRSSCKDCTNIQKKSWRKLGSNPLKEAPVTDCYASLLDLLMHRGATIRYHDHLKKFGLSISHPHIMLEEPSIESLIKKGMAALRSPPPMVESPVYDD